MTGNCFTHRTHGDKKNYIIFISADYHIIANIQNYIKMLVCTFSVKDTPKAKTYTHGCKSLTIPAIA